MGRYGGSGNCGVCKMIISVCKMIITEAERSFKNVQDAQDDHLQGNEHLNKMAA